MRPIAEMLRKASIRTRDRDSTHSRIPSNVPAPVEPPSTHVVTPVARAMSSVRGPKSDEPTKQCAWRSISPGRTSFHEPVAHADVESAGEAGAGIEDVSALEQEAQGQLASRARADAPSREPVGRS